MPVVKFEIYLEYEVVDRLFAVKEQRGLHHLTGNEFAKELLECELYRLHPQKVPEDEEDCEY